MPLPLFPIRERHSCKISRGAAEFAEKSLGTPSPSPACAVPPMVSHEGTKLISAPSAPPRETLSVSTSPFCGSTFGKLRFALWS